jgi:hypothetical protein
MRPNILEFPLRLLRLITIFTLAVAYLSGQAFAQGIDLRKDITFVSKTCIAAVQAGGLNEVGLLANGYQQRRNKFTKSYAKSVIGAAKPSVHVSYRKNVTTCTAEITIGNRSTGNMMFDTARQTMQTSGFRQVPYQSKRHRSNVAWQKGNILIIVGGSTGKSHSTYSGSVWFARVQ